MEFWGAEVKVGEVVKVDNKESDVCIHLSQVALGESKKDKSSEPVVVYLKVGEQKFVVGTLNKEKFPQIALDLVVEKEFELSHTSKNASVHFCGYKTPVADDEEDDFSDDSSDEDHPLPVAQNGKTEVKVEEVKVSQSKKPDAQAGASKQVKVVEPKKTEDSDDESDEDDEIDSSDEEMEDGESDEEGESDEDDDEEDTPPKKVDQGKKRQNESATKTPISNKKAKNATPEKTDAKKGGHTATPHPAKKGGKTPNSDGKDTPKSGGQFLCKSCNKNFNSETGLQQHSKAKHGQ
ncbi:histone deacetylase HDT1-like [Arachis stenosperma]|uniref:histone deacetylase HDT1-like n=1 Tax=Arachis stenosperma TaxID=217475 RepID=UPI0025AD1A48|nr:histone deacetylase HDT1-like [Arachis stenosperma]